MGMFELEDVGFLMEEVWVVGCEIWVVGVGGWMGWLVWMWVGWIDEWTFQIKKKTGKICLNGEFWDA